MSIGFLGGNYKGNEGIIVPCDFRNSICFGQTGSGKTTGYILPNIQERLKAGHTIIAFDFKGNLHSHIKKLAKDVDRLHDVVEIGPIWGHRINILLEIASKDIELWYHSLFKDTRYGYWEIASCNLLKTLYEVQCFLYEVHFVLKSIHSYCVEIEPVIDEPLYPTFRSLASMLDVTAMQSLMDTFKLIQDYLVLSLDVLDLRQQDREKLLFYIEKSERFNAFLTRYSKLKEEDSGAEYGNHGVISSLLNTIQDGVECDIVNGEVFDIDDLVQKKKIIVIYVDTLGERIAQLLNQRIFKFLSRRTIFFKEIQPVSIFIDEAHKVLISGSLPEVSLCRENSFEYILSVQDRILLENALGVQQVEEMMVNITHQISFKNDNISACSTLEPFYYKSLAYHSRFGVAEPIFFSQEELIKTLVEYQEILEIFKNFTNISQDGGYLVHDVSRVNDFIAIYVDKNQNASSLQLYNKKALQKRCGRYNNINKNNVLKMLKNNEKDSDNAQHIQEAVADFSKMLKKNLEDLKNDILQLQLQDKEALWKEIQKIYALLKVDS